MRVALLLVSAFGLLGLTRAGSWAPWQTWTACSKSCGTGTRLRSRICRSASIGESPGCPKGSVDKLEAETCTVTTCPIGECGGIYSAQEAVIESPGYPTSSTPANVNCTWVIQAKEGEYIELLPKKFSMQEINGNCNANHLEILGLVYPISSFCGDNFFPNYPYDSSSNTLTLNMVSTALNEGFEIHYNFKVKPNCQKDFCYNEGTCSGVDTCNCANGYLEYRCAYVGYHPQTTPVVASGNYNIPMGTCTYTRGIIQKFSQSPRPFHRSCQFVLTKTSDQLARGAFEVLIKRHDTCPVDSGSCLEQITITSDITVTIKHNYAVEINGKPASLPINEYGMQVTEKKWTIFVALSDLYVVIDKKDFTVFVAANSILSGKLEGLCGDIGQSEADNNVDLTWQKNPVDTACTSVTTPKTFCGNEGDIEKFIADYNEQHGVGPSTREILRHRESIVARDSICNVLDTTAFEDCRANISVVSYRAECLDALCQCGMDKVDSCHCSAVAKYARDCTLAGFEVGNWRTPTSCGRTCPGNQIYKDCGSGCLATCDTLDTAYCERQCIDGCQCPEATFWSGKSCVAQEACPCTHAKVHYAPGATINDGCTKRTCMGATWQNEKLDCAGVAVASSFSHYRTLDGTWYDFPGSTCSYLLAEDCGSVTPSFSVFVEVQECGRNPNPCIRNIKILHKVSSTKTYTVVLKEGKVLSETKVVVLPVTNGAITVHKLSSLYVEAVIADTGVSILWDGATARLSVPTAYKGKICGLAGTYNSRTTDDFRTRGGLDETTLGFGNSYKYPALCDDVTDAMAASDMCNHDAQAEVKAATDCGIMNGKLFEACRNVVEYLPFYKNCRKDACACEADKKCYCEAVNDFAQACRQAGVVVDWRSNATCPNLCPTGQVYMTNGTLCGRTCRSLMETEVCSPSQMVEGCGCHEGQYLDKDNKCVDINQCGCYVNNDWQLANHQSEPTKNVQCICEKGVLKCNRKDELTAEAINCTSGMTRRDCSNPMEKGVECAPVCGFLDRTCPITQCIPGCVCEGGLVRNGDNCINASECPCFHNNQEYQVGEAVTEGCKTMTCMPRSVWKVSNQSCYRQCRVAAGAYITTFDMKRYDFRGTCKYLLASDSCKTGENFLYRITMQSKDCQGSNQAMCQSTIHIIAGVQELTLTSNQTEKPQPTVIHSRTLETKNILFTGAITTVDIGDYRVVDLKNGIKITWDRKASVYIEIKKTVEKSTCGLCGLQNGDAADDFTTATNNLVTSAVDFGNSWKVDSCPDVVESVTPTCDPKKRKWAESQCAVLRSSQFKECNENVDVTYFYEKCIRETCTCDTGGDCSCFCDSVADYAKLCGEMSIAVKWRSADLCPRMCQANNVNDDQCVWKYKPCVPCTTFCCDVSPVCLGGCYEGCYPDCPEGTQYNSKNGTCVPKEKCDCLNPPVLPPVCEKGYEMVCKYNKWVNTHYSSEEKGGDFESSENVARAIGTCGYYTGIKCRSLNNPLAPLPAGVTCDVKTGLSCTNTPNNTCDDYEVSLECCDCEVPTCNVTCKEEPTCQPHQNKTLVNETACCKEYSCECIGCYTGGELRDPESSWRENCTDYTCVSDDAGCYKVNALAITCPEKSCPTYASLETTDTGECCPTKTCVCEQDFTPEMVATINCTAPKVLKVTDLVNGSLKCQRGECVCPGEKNMTNQHCVNSTSCPAPGCNIKDTHACGCPIESTCACDPDKCPDPLPCDPCKKTVTVPAEPDKSDAYRCEHETCCPRVECEPVDCTNVAKPTCQDYEEVKEYPATGDECCPSYNCSCNETQCAASKPECGIPEEIFTDGMLNPCCANRTCVCTKCLDAEENLRAINETWKSSECVTQICLEQESGCPLVKLYQDDSVCTKEVCATGQTSLPNTKSSTPCCNATCCVSDCYDQGQSYSAGSTWKAGTCMTKSCQCSCDGDCEIVEHPKYCTNSQKTCAIGQSRVDIPNPDDPCCPNVECQCACVAYGDPHYMTFDSRPYSFMGQCQYTLVTYRTAPSRLHIYSENEVCSTSPSGPLTCLKKVFVRWDYTTVELYQDDGISLSNSVFVNGSSVTLMWSGAGMTISMADSKVNLRIPEINLNLFYVTLATSPFVVIMIPVSTMFNKTVGLCGTCSADKQDDFEGSNKTIIDDVNDFGHSWRINECKKPNVTDCAALIGEGVTPLPSVCRNQTCEEDVCDLLTSSLFEKCQTISTAKDHRDNCIFDANRTKVCSICNSSAASSYAELCEMNGICVDWRKAANCSEPTCSAANTQYTACASQCQVTKTCGNYETLDRTCQSTKQVSGCFCKEGYVLRHPESTECIKTDCCSCSADPDCKPPKVLSVVPGTESNCCPTKQCVCPGQNDTQYNCKAEEDYNCNNDQHATEVLSTNPCCKNYTCSCNESPNPKEPNCNYPGQEMNESRSESDCYSTFNCICGTNMTKLEKDCPGYHETKAKCTKPDMKVSINQPAGYNSSDPCCPSYQCVCDTCAEKNITCMEGYEEKDLKTEGDCCSNWTCVCNSCKMENGTYIPIGTVYDETSDQCRLSKTCSKNRVSASDDSCRLIMTIFNENTTCTTLQSFQDNNCVKEGEIAVENGRVGCCMTYRCVCNTSGTSPPYKCLHPGEKAQEYNIETSCYPQYNCTCSTDMENLKNLCSDYQETKAKCTKPDMEVVVDKVAGYNASDPCCPSYKCVCQECKVGNQSCETGYSNVDVKNEEDCCSNWTCACNGCINSTNHIISRGDTFTEAKSNGCMETKTCSSIKTDVNDVTSCYSIETIHDTEDNCQPLEEYETKSCLANIEHAVKTEKPPGQCCDDFQCVCNNDTMLSKHCDYWTNYNCSRKGMIRVRTNPDDQCCPQYKCVCPSCPETNQTCDKQSWSPKVIDNEEYPEECGCKSTVCECDSSKCETEFPQSTCSQVWYTKNVVNETFYEGCCPKIECICNRSACNQTDGIDSCSLYQDTVETTADNTCCPRTFQCKCKNETELNKLCLRSDNTTNIPLGHEKVFQPNLETGQTSCCSNYTIECRYCITAYKELKSPGSRWTSKDGNCQVDNFCTSERLSNLGCYKINKTTEVCQSKDEYQESNCNVLEGELAYEVDDPTSCCQKYTCECNKTMSAETKPSCTYPGENLTLAEETKCHKNYTCLCSNDMKELENLCSGYQETKATCTKPDMKVSINQPAGYNSSNPCCPSYQCVCDTCAEKNITCKKGYEEKDLKTEGDCCSNWTCNCNSCKLANGSLVAVGEQYQELDPSGCPEKKICSAQKISSDPLSCHLPDTIWAEKDNCDTASNFEAKYCNKTGQYAVDTGNGACCTEYKCVCKAKDTSICSYSGEVRKDVAESPTSCPSSACVCANDTEYYKSVCANFIFIFCNNPLKEIVEVDGTWGGPCCPNVECRCKECTEPTVENCPKGYLLSVIKDECDCNKTSCECNSCEDTNSELHEIGSTWGMADSVGCIQQYDCSPTAKRYDNGRKCLIPSPIVKNCSKPNCNTCQKAEEVSYNATHPDPDLCCTEYLCVNQTCETAEQYKDKNCNPDQIVEVNSTTECCPKHACVCPDKKLPTCKHPGEVAKLISDGTSCPYYNCTCGTDMAKLPNLCPAYNETLDVCDKPDMMVTVDQSAGQNASNPCCPSYKCICKTCQPANVTSCDPGYVLRNLAAQGDCCANNTCSCDSCFTANGTRLERGQTYNVTDSQHCSVTKVCSSRRVDESDEISCYVIDTNYKQIEHCTKLSDFESNYCQAGYQHAEALTVTNQCCDEFQCVCNNATMLLDVCEKSNVTLVQCKEAGRENMTYVTTGECCQKLHCPCLKGSELDAQCPGSDLSCDYSEHKQLNFTDGLCCPTYSCTCKPCPINHTEKPDRLPAIYEKYVALNTSENPLQKCCPKYKIVCGDTGKCPKPNCTGNTTMVQTDATMPGTRDCCPLHVCRCDVCELTSGYMVALHDTWKEDIGGGCNVTRMCSEERTTLGDMESCHVIKNLTDPTLRCKSITEYEHELCSSVYLRAVPYEEVPDTDPCCSGYRCQCKNAARLSALCPPDEVATCGNYTHKEVDGFMANTSDCCPLRKCVCDDESILKTSCDQWDDFTCPLGEERIQLEQRNSKTGPCCPKYRCQCMNNAMLQSVCAQWNVTCAIGLRRVRTNALSECCPEFECVCDKCVQNEIAFPIGSSIRNDSCYASSCVRNTTTKCPQIVSYNKYECEPINQTCVERGGRILANLSTSGCCKYCEESPYPCAVGTRNVILNATVEGHRCWTNKAYDINYCSGSCPTTQHINPTSGLIAGKCKCCKPAFTASRNYDMVCDDATPRKHSQLTILSCTCKDTTCEEAAAEKVVVPAK